MNDNIFSLLKSVDVSESESSNDTSDVTNWIVVSNKHDNSTYTPKRQDSCFIDINSFVNKKKSKPKKENHKTMLCKNIIAGKQCKYGNKCLYAHSLNEQKLDEIRDRAYKMIRGDIDVSTVNIYFERDLYKLLLSLCESCTSCKNGNCTGGYNCKHGACKEEYVICGVDLNNGNCTKQCNKVHLTERGLKPYFSYLMDSQKKKPSILTKDTIGTLLTNEFFKKIKKTDSCDSDDCMSNDSYDSNDDSDTDFTVSVFKVKLA